MPRRAEAFRRGGRPGAQKVMIVITDGESHDSPQLVQAVGDSERDNITMYAIAVSPTPNDLLIPSDLSDPGSASSHSKHYSLTPQSSHAHTGKILC